MKERQYNMQVMRSASSLALKTHSKEIIQYPICSQSKKEKETVPGFKYEQEIVKDL
jgi:hypothetical protein